MYQTLKILKKPAAWSTGSLSHPQRNGKANDTDKPAKGSISYFEHLYKLIGQTALISLAVGLFLLLLLFSGLWPWFDLTVLAIFLFTTAFAFVAFFVLGLLALVFHLIAIHKANQLDPKTEPTPASVRLRQKKVSWIVFFTLAVSLIIIVFIAQKN
jgi:small-conductance mechanosensitive channel